MDNKPRAREKRVREGGKGVTLHGPSGMGQVGSGSAMGSGASGGGQRSGGGGKMGMIIALIVMLLGGGGVGVSSMLGGGDTAAYEEQAQTQAGQQTQQAQSQGTSQQTGAASAPSGGGGYQGSPLAGLFGNISSTSAGWTGEQNTGVLDTKVNPSARERYTTI